MKNLPIMLAVCLAILGILMMGYGALAHDKGQFEGVDPEVKEWYQALMQPDNPHASCCGEADAYWADKLTFESGKAYATITDDRDDGPLKRPHVPNGTVIEIPSHKLKWDKGNPTGHNIIFLSRTQYVFCYVQGTGI